MNQSSLHIVVFGMSLRILNDLKSTILDIIPNNIEVNWANIASPKIDVLMINVDFFDVPSIQKIIQNNNVKVLKMTTNSSKQGVIEQNTLNLPLQNNLIPFKNWVLDLIDLQSKSDYQAIITTEKKTQSEKYFLPSKAKQSIVDIVKEIQNPKNGKMQIFDTRGILAIVEPRNEWVWSKITDTSLLRTDSSLNYTYAKLSDSESYARDIDRTDLKNWLWNLLWQSLSIDVSHVKASDFFLMDFWPQPLATSDRRDILRISACFSHGASIKQVAQHLNLSDDRVRQFIVTSMSVGFAHQISASEAKLNTTKQSTNSNQGFMKKLFGGLRKRLGI